MPRFGPLSILLILLALLLAWILISSQELVGNAQQGTPAWESEGTFDQRAAPIKPAPQSWEQLAEQRLLDSKRKVVPTIDPTPVASISVLDAQSGLPAPGVALEIAAAVDSRDAWREYRTDEKGVIKIKTEYAGKIFQLRPSKRGSRARQVNPELLWVQSEKESVVIVDCSAVALQLHVFGPTRLPAAHAIVHLSQETAGKPAHYLVQETDERGQLTLAWPPAGGSTAGWRAVAQHVDEGASAPQQIPDLAEPERVELFLEAGHRLDLRVQDSAGNAFPYAEVRLRGLQLSQQRFVAQLMADPCYLDFSGEISWTHLLAGNYELSLRSPVGVGWLSRRVEVGPGLAEIVWTIDQEPEPVALAGKLLHGANWPTPIVNQYLELIDAESRKLIAGTRTDAAGAFKLFGDTAGPVLLLPHELDNGHDFGADEFRFPAGKQDVRLEGHKRARYVVAFRVLDAATDEPIPDAILQRRETQLPVIVAHANEQGVLRTEIQEGLRYELTAPGYAVLALDDERDFESALRLQPLR